MTSGAVYHDDDAYELTREEKAKLAFGEEFTQEELENAHKTVKTLPLDIQRTLAVGKTQRTGASCGQK